MTDQTIPFTILQGLLATAGSAANVGAITTAQKGGADTAQFFANQIPLSLFCQQIGTGAISVIPSYLQYQDKSGAWVVTQIPIFFAMAGLGSPLSMTWFATVTPGAWAQMKRTPDHDLPMDTELYIADRPDWRFGKLSDIVKESTHAQQLQSTSLDETALPSVTYDGITYNIYGSVENVFHVDQNPVWWVTAPVGLTTIALGIVPSMVAFKYLALPAIKLAVMSEAQVWSVIGAGFGNISGFTTATAEATELTVEEIVGEGVTVTMACVGAVCVVAVIALTAIAVVVSKVAHYTYNAIQVYNLSDYDMVWQVPHIYSGAMNTGPVVSSTGGSDDYQQWIGGYRNLTPGKHVAPQPAYGSASFTFMSSSAYKGLGEAFGFELFPANPAATSAGFYKGQTPSLYGAFGVNIPWDGDNSIDCQFSESPISSDNYWQTTVGDGNGQQTTLVTATNQALNLTLTISIDYLSGTHPNNQGLDEYYYQTIVVLKNTTDA